MTIPDLTHRKAHLHEDMDAISSDIEMLHRTYAYFPIINALVSGWYMLYQRCIRPQLSPTHLTTLLDIGCGGGDITRNLVKWSTRDGLLLDATGIDTDPRATAYANDLPLMLGVRFKNVSSHDLVEAGEKFDLVISNHMLHHLSEEEIPQLLDDCARLSKREVILSDLRRSKLSYALFALASAPFFARSFIKQDGLTSIERAFTPAELEALLPPNWTRQPQFFHRHLIRYQHEKMRG